MPMPSLHPLVKAAYQAYDDLSKARNASYLYMHYVFIRTISLIGYDNTNPEKIKILKDLAELELSGTVEEQNKTLYRSFEETLLKNDARYKGRIFTPLSTIMMTCMLLTQNRAETLSIDSIEKHFFEFNVSNYCETLKKQGLAQDHLFFKELHNFITELKANANELAVKDRQEQKSIERQLRETKNEKKQQNVETHLKRKRQMEISPQIKTWMYNNHGDLNPKFETSYSPTDVRPLGFYGRRHYENKNNYGHPFQPDHAKHSNKRTMRRI